MPPHNHTQIEILLEPSSVRGSHPVSLTAENIAEKSAQALTCAMDAMKGIAQRVQQEAAAIPVSEAPDEITVAFGLQLTTNGTALVVSTGMNAQFEVTLKWLKDK